MDEFPELLTSDETEALLGVPESILRRMVESHLIPVYRVSGSLRFDKKDVLNFIERNRQPSGEVNTYIAIHKSHPKGRHVD